MDNQIDNSQKMILFNKCVLMLFLAFGLSLMGLDESLAIQSSVPQNENLAQVQVKNGHSEMQLISLEVSNVSLIHVLELIARELRVGLSFESEIVPDKNISIRIKDKPVHDVLDQILSGTNLEVFVPTSRDVIILREIKFDNFHEISETVRGVVTDSQTGVTLPGVNIMVVDSEQITGSVIGAITNMNGEFVIELPEGLNSLRFSYVGYTTKIVEVDGRTALTVQLQPDLQQLDDVVVVGYGTQDRREITSSVASISSEDFVSGNIQDAEQLLQGKVAGLIISRPGGDPNADFNIRLRGLSTIGANTEPLVVIDGVIGASLNSVDPNDIESIDVLKDASASAIYGTRGANGVILVTTKSGRSDSSQGISVTYNGQISSQIVGNSLDMLSAQEFRDFVSTSGLTTNDFGASTNWFDEVTQNAYTHTHGISVAGGDAATSYRLSGNYRDVQAIQKGVGQQRLNTRINIVHRALEENLTLQGNFVYTNREEKMGLPEVFRYAIVSNPTAPVRNPDGTYFEQDGFDIFNPVAIMKKPF